MKPGSREGALAIALSTLLALALALLLAGCGGASGTAATAPDGATTSTRGGEQGATERSASPSASPTARFVARADAICRHYNAELGGVKSKGSTVREVERVVPIHAALEHAAIAALEKLRPPVSLAGSWRSLLSDRRTLADELDQLVTAARRHQFSVTHTLTVSKKVAHKRLAATASRGGFKDCGTVG